MLRQVAVVSQSKAVLLDEVVKVTAALQKQVSRDFAPIWAVNATVDAFAKLSDVPLGYWPIIIRDDVVKKFDAAGIHLDKNGQPFSLVQTVDDWAQTASHECLEMLADPFGERIIAGAAPTTPSAAKRMKRVEYLVEVCDPSEATEFAYSVNDIVLSDFYTPNYFDPVTAPGVRYSFTGAITRPRQVLKGGYISFHNTVDDHWYQIQWFTTAKPVLEDLGIFETSAKSTREWIDSKTRTPHQKKSAKKTVKPGALYAAMPKASGAPGACDARASMIEAHIAELLG